MEVAERYLYKLAQHDAFGEEINQLENGLELKQTSSIVNLNPFMK